MESLMVKNASKSIYVHHGMTKTPEYRVWAEMKGRCSNPRNKSYHNYGARGIFVCREWIDSFEKFITDMGRRPSKNHSIDRIDNSKGYSPSNCKWVTRKEQSNNQRSNVMISFMGERIS